MQNRVAIVCVKNALDQAVSRSNNCNEEAEEDLWKRKCRAKSSHNEVHEQQELGNHHSEQEYFLQEELAPMQL